MWTAGNAASTETSQNRNEQLHQTFLRLVRKGVKLANDQRFAEAAAIFEEAVQKAKELYGPEHRAIALTLKTLADMYDIQRQYSRAEPLYIKSLEISTKLLGPNHQETAVILGNLASLYHEQGLYRKAKPLYVQALQITQKAMGSEHPSTATALNNLASLYLETGMYNLAEPLLLKALAINQKSLGPDHLDTANSLNSLAVLYGNQGLYGKAEPLYHKALSIRQAVLGPDNRLTATTINNLAALYYEQGDLRKAKTYFIRALAINANALGPGHPNTAITKESIAIIYQRQGLYEKAEPLFRETIASVSSFLQAEAPYLPKAERQAFVESLGALNEAVLSLPFQKPSMASLALFLRLNCHGILEQIEKRQSQLSALASTQHETNQELKEVTQKLASSSITSVQRRELKARQKELERQLYRMLPELKPKIVEVDQVASALTPGSALLEFQRYRPADHRSRPRQAWGNPRYLALVLKPDRFVQAVDLGPAAPIDQQIQQALKASEQNQQDAAQQWAQVSRSILNPLARATSGLQVLFVSPDGELNRIPFAALPVEGSGKLLAEAVRLRLLTTGRDLLELRQPASNPRGAALVVANPSFDRQLQPTSQKRKPFSGELAGQQRSADLRNNRWKSLPATAREGQTIASLTQGRLLLQEQATAAAVQQQPAPRILHIASHAFFLADQQQQADAKSLGLPRSRKADSPVPLHAQGEENPLLRSGIALAGANLTPASATDDGYLMALEVAQLDWKGTELVVVSACESGKGDIKAGEGVYGLRRAIAVAGARSSLLSLWKVDDEATAEFMTRFYTRLKAGQGRAEALASVQSEFRKGTAGNGQWKEPCYWAAWQLVGDWGAIQGL